MVLYQSTKNLQLHPPTSGQSHESFTTCLGRFPGSRRMKNENFKLKNEKPGANVSLSILHFSVFSLKFSILGEQFNRHPPDKSFHAMALPQHCPTYRFRPETPARRQFFS
jgi:hypothetical protein